MALIDLSNYSTTLVQSTVGRAGTPDGNVFFDTTGTIEFIPVEELATVVYPIGHPSYTDGTTAVPNPLSTQDGLKFEAIYAFENSERASDEVLRKFNRWTSGTFKFGGAYNFINGRTPSTTADSDIIRGSGWNEYDIAGGVTKIQFGNKGLSNIGAASAPYYQLGNFTTAIPYAKVGQIDEAITVYTDINGDGTPDTDSTLDPEIVSVRTYGKTYDRKSTIDDLGIAELGGYSTGFAVNEGVHLTTNETDMPFANVWTVPAGVWLNVTLEKLAVALNRNEFAETAGDFTWVINNPDSTSLNDIVAYLDAIATVTADIDTGAESVTIGKDVNVWYSYNAAGQVITNSGADALGLYIYNVPVADQQRVKFTDDAGALKSYQFLVGVEANIGATAKADVNAWYHSFGSDAYNTAGAIEVQDSSAAVVSGMASSADVSNLIKFNFDYDGDTVLGTAATNKNCTFLCEGDGGATQAKTLYTLSRATTIAFTCAPGVETNA
jgi:hypothetical protein